MRTPEPSPWTAEIVIAGQGSAPGRACGPLRRNRPGLADDDAAGAILVAERVVPEDVGRILNASGTLTLGGSLLSHMNLLSRELGRPSVALSGPGARLVPPGGHGILRLAVSRGSSRRELTLDEGDVVLIDGDRGLLRIPGGDHAGTRRALLQMHDLLTRYAGDPDSPALDRLVAAVAEGGLDEQRMVLEGAILCRVVPSGQPARRLLAALRSGGRGAATETIVAALIEEVHRRQDLACRNHCKRIGSVESVEELERIRDRFRRHTEHDRVLLADLGGSSQPLDDGLAAVTREVQRRAGALRGELAARATAALALNDDAIRRDLALLERLAREARASFVDPDLLARLDRRLAAPLAARRARAEKTLVVELTRTEAAERSLVGGKAAGLMRLRRALPSGCRVPRGFVIATPAYRLHLSADTAAELRERLERADDDAAISRRAREAILTQAIPKEIERAVRRAAERLGNARLAVRSSATVEDEADASLAGLFDSSLGTGGRQSLLDRVRRVWASLWNPHALRWMTELGQSPLDAAMAVIVQELVTTRVAGVLFTRDPEDPASSMLVNAAWGLGESISTGAISGDLFWIEREHRRLAAVRPGGSETRIVPDPGRAGTVSEAVPDELRGRACLDAGQVARLAEAGLRVEAEAGTALGIEFGFDDDGTLLLFQARRVPGGAE